MTSKGKRAEWHAIRRDLSYSSKRQKKNNYGGGSHVYHQGGLREKKYEKARKKGENKECPDFVGARF